MTKILAPLPKRLEVLKKPPTTLYYQGNPKLLKQKLISIVGTRHPNQYTKEMTRTIAAAFAKIGYTVVSGAAMGVDALAHQGAMPQTIAVMANSLDISYPAVNKKLISKMSQEALVLSEYEANTRATKYAFVIRNRIVVALGEALIITEADENSGTMRSAEIAIELGRPIYVLSHRAGESLGTQKLLREGDASLITDVDDFIAQFGRIESVEEELLFFKSNPTLSEALAQYGDKIYEWELEGKICINNLKVHLS